MDRIYIELIDKDNLIAQSKISRSKELLLYRALDSAEMDVTMLKMQANILQSDYSSLLYMYKKKQRKLRRIEK